MFLDITREDISAAYSRSKTRTAVHAWHNPIAIALERKWGNCSVVITGEMVHVHGEGTIGRFRLTDAAWKYLYEAFLSGTAAPVERMQVFAWQSLSA